MLSIVPSPNPASCKPNRAESIPSFWNTSVSARIWDLHSILVDPASAPSEAKDASKQILNILEGTAARVPRRMVLPPLSPSIDHEDIISPPGDGGANSIDFLRALTVRARPEALPPWRRLGVKGPVVSCPEIRNGRWSGGSTAGRTREERGRGPAGTTREPHE